MTQGFDLPGALVPSWFDIPIRSLRTQHLIRLSACPKMAKDRKGRELIFEDILHYQNNSGAYRDWEDNEGD